MKRLNLIPAILLPCLAAWHMMPASTESSVEPRNAEAADVEQLDDRARDQETLVTTSENDSNPFSDAQPLRLSSKASMPQETSDTIINASVDASDDAPASVDSTSLTLNGSIQALTYIDVPARREGMLDSLNVRVGSVVQKGQVIGLLDDVREVKSLERATADYNAARLKAENVYSVDAIAQDLVAKQRRMQRIEILKKDAKLREFIAPTSAEIDDLQAAIKKLELEREAEEQNLRSAKAEAESSAAELAIARDELDRSQVASLASGIITEIFHFPGDWMQKGDPLATVVRMDRLQVKVAIPLDQSNQANTGSAAKTNPLNNSTAILGLPPGQWIGAKARILTRSNLNNEVIERTGRLLNIIPERMGSSSGDAFIEFENRLMENQQGERVWEIWLAQEATVILELPVRNDQTALTSAND